MAFPPSAPVPQIEIMNYCEREQREEEPLRSNIARPLKLSIEFCLACCPNWTVLRWSLRAISAAFVPRRQYRAQPSVSGKVGHLPFASSPRSTSLRMASNRSNSEPLAAIHLSTFFSRPSRSSTILIHEPLTGVPIFLFPFYAVDPSVRSFYFSFAFSPSSATLRNASERLVSVAGAQACTSVMSAGDNRIVMLCFIPQSRF